MSSLQLASFRPQIHVKISRMSYVPCNPTTSLKLTFGRHKYQRCPPVSVYNDGDKSEYSNQGPSIGDAGKKLSLEEILRLQIEKQEYDQDDTGGNPPSDGGGGRGRRRRGGGRPDSGGSEEETPAERLNELLQVTLATIGLILLYSYILHGPEITRLGKDYLRYLVTGNTSVRLKRSMYVCSMFWKSLTTKRKVAAADDSISLLQRHILNTPTWFDSPSKYEHLANAYMEYKLSE